MSSDRTYELCASYTAHNIPENISISLASTAQELYSFIELTKSVFIEDDQLGLSYEIAKTRRTFRLPLAKQFLNEKDATIARLQKENMTLRQLIN